MSDPRWSATRAAELRHRYVSEHGCYHTVIYVKPKVWHADPGCPGGQQIPVENLRGGRGDRERRWCGHC